MKCKLEGNGPAILISCFGLNKTDEFNSLDYNYSVTLPESVTIQLNEKGPIWKNILQNSSYTPLLRAIQGSDNDELLFKSIYDVFAVTAGTLGIDPSLSSFAHTLDKLSKAAMALEKLDYDNYSNDIKELDKKPSQSSDGLVRGLKRISVVCDDVGKSFEDTTEKLTTLNNLK